MEPPQTNWKVYPLAFLIFSGLGLVAFGCVPSAFPESRISAIAWGVGLLLVAAVWIFWDHKRRVLTPDEQTEKLLMDVAHRYRETQDLGRITAEYHAQGASELTLLNVKSAPKHLRKKANAKILLGVELLILGILFSIAATWVAQRFDSSHYEVAIGAIGAGAGFLISGLRMLKAFPPEATKPS